MDLNSKGQSHCPHPRSLGPHVPGRKPTPRSVAPKPVSKAPLDAEETLRLILARLEDMKAEDPVSIDTREKTAFSDYMVVASGTSNRHVGAMADRVVRDLAEAGLKGIKVEGLPNCDWVLIDAGDVIVHVFRPEVRSFYDLEKMWAGGKASPQTGELIFAQS